MYILLENIILFNTSPQEFYDQPTIELVDEDKQGEGNFRLIDHLPDNNEE